MPLAILWGKSSREDLQASAEGLRACGYETKFLRPQVEDVEGNVEPCDVAVMAGTRLQSAKIRDWYRDAGTRVVVVDAPAIRLEGFHAVTPWRVNNLPRGPVNTDRLHLLSGIEPVRKPGWRVLVCGQTPEDAAHLLTQDELRGWYAQTLALLGAAWGAEHVLWRPHPHNDGLHFEGFGRSQHETIDEALEDGVAAVVTFNSTTGLRALIRRVPVFCHPFSFYAGVAEVGLPSPFNLRVPDRDRLLSFLSRVLYSQFSRDELTTEFPWRYVLGRMEGSHRVAAVCSS